jgi:hypothetical protein
MPVSYTPGPSFTCPVLFWIGDGNIPDQVAADPSFVQAHRFELLSPARQGRPGPRRLIIAELAGPRAIEDFMHDPEGSRYPATSAWRKLAESGPPTGSVPYSIYLVGMDLPVETSADDLALFDEFYTKIHLPEVLADWGYQRGSRYECFYDAGDGLPPSPRFCAIYEADETATLAIARRRADMARSGLTVRRTAGPRVWNRRSTVWQLSYRRLAAGTGDMPAHAEGAR